MWHAKMSDVPIDEVGLYATEDIADPDFCDCPDIVADIDTGGVAQKNVKGQDDCNSLSDVAEIVSSGVGKPQLDDFCVDRKHFSAINRDVDLCANSCEQMEEESSRLYVDGNMSDGRYHDDLVSEQCCSTANKVLPDLLTFCGVMEMDGNDLKVDYATVKKDIVASIGDQIVDFCEMDDANKPKVDYATSENDFIASVDDQIADLCEMDGENGNDDLNDLSLEMKNSSAVNDIEAARDIWKQRRDMPPIDDTNADGNHPMEAGGSEPQEEPKPPKVIFTPLPIPPDPWHVMFSVRRREMGYSNRLPGAMNFRHETGASIRLVERLKLHTKLDNHSGCVNALHFNETGFICSCDILFYYY